MSQDYMAKAGEKTYFKEIGADGVAFTLAKPFSDPNNVGSLLHDIAAVFTLLPKPPARILDLGCGSGWTSSFYAKGGYEVVGVDISPDAVKAAKKHFKDVPNLTFKAGDYDELSFSNEFDAVVFFDSLHHAEEECEALKTAYKALKPGGVLIANEPGVGHSKTQKSLDAVAKYGVNERDMPPKLLRPQLREAGFKSIKTYAYPAIAHRTLYLEREGIVGKLRNTNIARGLVSLLLSTFFLLRNHGVVTATKPKAD
jgi:2-polyprenyl-3-methyl-5-hydroxy-6-metoxy-1,4-benzoquinol methylase